MKPIADVRAECRTLTPAEVRIFDPVEDEDRADGICSPASALFLYLANALKYDQVPFNRVVLVLRSFARPLEAVAGRLHAEFAARQSQLPRYTLAFWDDRLATLSGVATGVDLKTGERLDPGACEAPVKMVSYNLTALLVACWAGSVAPAEQPPDADPDPAPGAPAGH